MRTILTALIAIACLAGGARAADEQPQVIIGGVLSNGFYISIQPPFFFPRISGRLVFLEGMAVPRGQPRAPAILWSFQKFDAERPLEDQIHPPGSYWTLEDSREESFAGTAGIRVVGLVDGLGKGRLVVHAAVIEGQIMKVQGEGAVTTMSPAVVAAIDAIAATVRRQNKSEQALAQGN